MRKTLTSVRDWFLVRVHHLTATHIAHCVYCGMVSAFAHELYAYAAAALLILARVSFTLNKEV